MKKMVISIETKEFDPEKIKNTIDTIAMLIKTAPVDHVHIDDDSFRCYYKREIPSVATAVPADTTTATACNCDHHHDQPDPKPKKESTPEKTSHSKGICKNCENEFEQKRCSQVFCSTECRNDYFAHKKMPKSQRQSSAKTNTVKAATLPPIQPVPQPESKKLKLKCEVCESIFESDKIERFCPKCVSSFGRFQCMDLARDTAAKNAFEKQNKADKKFKVCPRCGTNFEAKDANQFFCEKCIAKATGAPKIKPLEKE